MNELIKINQTEIQGQEVNTVNARELWEFIESKQQFSHWIQDRVQKYGFIESQDFLIILSKSAGRPASDYFISIDMAKELAMVENNEKGRQIRKYFIEVEKKWKNLTPALTKLEILEMAIESEKKVIALQGQIEEQKPLVQFAETFQAASGNILVRQMAKMIGRECGERRLFDWMLASKILIKTNEPYQKYVDEGYFVMKVGTHDQSKGKVTHYTLTITPKGQYWIWKRWHEDHGQCVLRIGGNS